MIIGIIMFLMQPLPASGRTLHPLTAVTIRDMPNYLTPPAARTAPPTTVRMYKATDIGRPGVPLVRAADQATLRHIEGQVPRAYRRNIWWGYTGSPKATSKFIVIYSYGKDPNVAEPGMIAVRYYKILGASSCNQVYSPIVNGSVSTPECSTIP